METQILIDELCNLINNDKIQISKKKFENNNSNNSNIELINVDQEQIFKDGKEYMLGYIRNIVKAIEKERKCSAIILRNSRYDLENKNLEIRVIKENFNTLSIINQSYKNEIAKKD